MTRAGVCSWFIGLAVALPAAAMADQAYTTTAVNLRAGPETDYPVVRWVPEGTAVEVHGCLADYRWCDVEAFGDRGWMSASFLVYPYQNSNVPIVTYGAIIGLPLIGFTFDSYWDDHYRRRPWYGERHRWADRYRPEYNPPRYREPPPRPPQYYPPAARPPQYYPPAARPPEFRPPPVQQQPARPYSERQPYYRGRDDRSFPQQQERSFPQQQDRSFPQQDRSFPQPGVRGPSEMRAPMPPTARPPAPAPRAPSGAPSRSEGTRQGPSLRMPDTTGGAP